MKISIQGIPGSFHHQVAIQYFGEDASVESFKTFEEVAKVFGQEGHNLVLWQLKTR